jgi:hypothetical protein
MYKIAVFLAFGLFAIGFFIKSISFIDPDFGWHYRIGEFILAHGIPRTDIYSYTMPDFPYVEHEWLTDIGMYVFYQKVGYYGLACAYTLIAIVTLYILHQQTLSRSVPVQQILTGGPNDELSWLSLIPILFTGEIFILYGGVRDQVIPWLLAVLILWICNTRKEWKYTRYLIPIIMTLWANMHGSFPFGIVITAISVITRGIKAKQIEMHSVPIQPKRMGERMHLWQDTLVLILCGIATLINPYTWHLWVEVWREEFMTSWHWTILEWEPTFFVIIYSFVFFLPISLILIWLYRREYSFFLLLLYSVSLLMALSAQRHVPFWADTAFLLTTEGLGHLQKQLQPSPGGEKSYHQIYLILLLITIAGVGLDVWYTPPNLHVVSPEKAIQYLQTHKVKGHLFADYNWGGDIIWHLPGVKTFVNGQMPSWQFSTKNSHESTNAYQEYQDILLGKEPFPFAVRKYDIGTILWPSMGKQLKDQKMLRWLQAIRNAGFKKVYQDNIAVIYEK